MCTTHVQFAEAPKKVLADQVAALTEEFGREAAKRCMGTVAKSRSNSARLFSKVVSKYKFSLPVTISFYAHVEPGGTVRMPYLRPSLLLQRVMSAYPWMFLGGLHPGRQAANALLAFWEGYRRHQPGHAVFQCDPARLSRTIPVVLHGDGGRTQKKTPLEILSLEAVLGLDTGLGATQTCRCKEPMPYGGDDFSLQSCLQLNHKHNSYLSKLLLFAFPSKEYKATPGLMKALLADISRDLGQLCENGLHGANGHWYTACLGMKGDLEYHQKTGMLQRCYVRVGTVNPLQCCHLCEAGSALYPFEDTGLQAAWLQSSCLTLPWAETPPFQHIPFEDWPGMRGGKAALFFRLDPFHTFRLGIARNFIASTLILLCFEGCFDSQDARESHALEARLERAWSYFMLFCVQEGSKPLGMKSFSKAKLHYERTYQYPYITGKGSDAVLILKFLIFFSQLLLREAHEPLASLLRLVEKGAEAGLFFTQSIHGHGLFLSGSCASTIKRNAQRFCDVYARLAARCVSMRMTRCPNFTQCYISERIWTAVMEAP